ncbi:TPR-like protein [Xylaria arbuscula]|nr:TPR-like protein [Xylaria arbuscula]
MEVNLIILRESEGMSAISDLVRQTLRDDTARFSSLLSINTREGLFHHINSLPNRSTWTMSYSVRVNGVLKSLDGFVELVRQSIQYEQDDFPDWPAMIWGSTAWILADFYGRTAGHEYVLTMLEDFTTATALPFRSETQKENQSKLWETFILQLFAELSVGLLKLALSLKMNPSVPAKKSVKFQDFEAEHKNTVKRVRSWASKILDAQSGRTVLAASSPPSVTLVSQPAATIPVPLNKYFQGRQDDIRRLYESLHTGEERLAVVCVHGLPGIGKTQTTIQYCRTFDTEYFASIWIESDTRTKILSAFSRYAVRLKIEGASAHGEHLKNAQLLVSWLQTTDLPWLLVFDNVDEAYLLNDFWPSGGKGHVISTSRSPYMLEFCAATSLHLDSLSRVDSLDLLRKIIGDGFKDQHTQEFEEILDEWKGVPLALNHVGNFISRMHIDLNRFVKTYRRSTAKILSTRHDMDAYPHSIATAFSVTELDGPSRSLLQILCFLDPADISDELFLPSFDEEKSLSSIGTDLEYYASLSNLCKSGLVIHDRGHITIHRLVQVIGFSDMSDDEQRNTFQEVLELIDGVFPRARETLETWESCDRKLPHVMFLCKRYRQLYPEDRKNATLADLLSACTWYMYERGLHAEAEPLVQLARIVCPDTPECLLTFADILLSLLGLYFEGNRIKESLILVNQVFDIRASKLDPLDRLVAISFSLLGIVYLEAGQLDTSLASNLNAVHIFECRRESLLSDVDDEIDWAYSNLTFTLLKLGQLDEASNAIEKARDIAKLHSGTSSIRYGQRLWNLGLVRSAQNRWEDAREAHKASLDIFLSLMPNSFKTAFGFHKMATFFHREGNFEQALNYLESAHSIFQRGLDLAPRAARTMFKVSEVLKDMGRVDEAAAKRKEAARLRSLVNGFPYDNRDTYEAYDTLVPWIWR